MKTKSFLLIFSVIFLLLSAIINHNVTTINPHHDVDSKGYIAWADHFYEKQLPHIFPYFTVGYPLIMASLYTGFGKSVSIIIWFQILIALLCGLLIFGIARQLFGELVARISFALFSINLGFLTLAQFILTDLILAFFLLAFVYVFTKYLTLNKQLPHVSPCKLMRILLCAGLILGFSIWIKPAALYFLVPVLVLLVWFGPSYDFLSSFALIFALSFLLPIGLYLGFNKVLFKKAQLNGLAQTNIYFWYLPNVLAELHGTKPDDERVDLQAIARSKDGMKRVKQIFWQTVYDSPVLALYVWMKNVFKTLMGLYTTNLKVLLGPEEGKSDNSFFAQSGGWWKKIHNYIANGATHWVVIVVGYLEFLYQIVRYILVVLALGVLLRKREWALTLFVLAFLGYFLMVSGHDGCARFRMMVEGVLIVLTAVGVMFFYKPRIKGAFS